MADPEDDPMASALAEPDITPEMSEEELDPDVVMEEAADPIGTLDQQYLDVRLSTSSSVRSVDGDTLHSDEVDTAEEAGQVYVMMDGTFRVSRNTRAQWFLQYLNKTVVWNPEDHAGSTECEPLEIISCIPRRPAFPAADVPVQSLKRSYRITQNTAVTFLSKTYRLVFALDLTPSMSAVSMINRNLAFDELFIALRDCFTAISQPTLIPGTTTPFTPKVFVTVLAHAPFLSTKSTPVIIKGFKLLPETLPLLLKIVRDELLHLEDDIIPRLNAEVKKYSYQVPSDDGRWSKPFITMDMTLANILRKGLLSAQLLPDNSCGHIIVVTDGIVDFPDVTVMDSLLSQLRTHTISVSFIRVGYTAANNSIGSDFGYLCNTDLMEFIAKTTAGAYVEHKPFVVCEGVVVSGLVTAAAPVGVGAGLRVLGELDGSDASIFQKAFFTWNFQQGLDGVGGDVARRPDSFACDSVANRLMNQCYSPRTTLEVSVGGLLSIRLREGFTIKSVTFKGSSHIDIVLTMPWKPEISLEYRIGAVWPPTEGTPVTAEIHVEAPYEFLYDLSLPSPKGVYGKFRLATLKQFKHTVQSLEQTDWFLLHFEQFRSSPAHYTLPDVIRDGMPVFYIPPDDLETPTFSTQDLQEHPEFTNFWRPLCVMDVNLWHKWLHVHRISLLVEHDRPLLPNIFVPKRTATVRCNLALNKLHDLLRTWNTIALVDNHSYIRFIFDEQESMEIPKSFFIVRMAAKPPCVVLRLAFLGGTSGNVRHKIIAELDELLANLALNPKSTGSEVNGVLCCWKMVKPVEKMLIQYKDVPSELSNTSLSGPTNQDKSTQTPFPVANPGAFQALSRFLYCRRYVWQPFQGAVPVLDFDVIGRVLTSLAKLRLREGFRFASTSGGVFNLTMEIEMKDVPAKRKSPTKEAERPTAGDDFPPCVAQYIIFPPRAVRDVSRDETGDGVAQDKFSVAVEVWLEPQYGVAVCLPKTSAAYLDGLKYKEIPQKIHEVDTELLSTFLTFETLFAICGKDSGSSRRAWQSGRSDSTMTSSVIAVHPSAPNEKGFDENAEIIEFPFDIPRFIAKCQRTRMLFCSFRQSRLAKNVEESNELLFHYFITEVRRMHVREIELTKSDCRGIFDVLRDGDGVIGPLASLTASSSTNYDDDSGGAEEMPPALASDEKHSAGVEWKAFVRRLADDTLVAVTIVPASYTHLCKINQTLDISDIDGVGTYTDLSMGVLSDSTAVSHGEGDSECDYPFTKHRPFARPVPVFIFTCSFESLQGVLMSKRPASRAGVMEFDLTGSFNCVYDRKEKRFSECRPEEFPGADRGASLRSSSFSLRSHKDDNKLFELFTTLENAFAKAFVQGVYKSLHLGLDVDPYDISTVTDGLCAETPVELDLTTFIKAICAHFRELTGKRSRRPSGNRKSNESVTTQLYPRPPPETHSSIRAQFQNAIASCLKVAPHLPDIFFFSLAGFHELADTSMSEVDLNNSDVSEGSVEFRIDSATNLRESVSGHSEVESSPGFFTHDPDSAGSAMSVFGSGDSQTTDRDAEYDEEEDGVHSPLFVQFICNVMTSDSKKPVGGYSVRELPTCLSDIMTAIDHKGSMKGVDLVDIQIRLDMLCLYLPDDLKNIEPIEARSSMRTISGGSSSGNLRGSDSDISTIHDEGTTASDMDDLVQLPLEQSEKMRNMVDSLKWHLQDEIAYMLSNGEGMPSEENLRLVVDHVQHPTSKQRLTCIEQAIPLKFVFNVELSFAMFIDRFEKSIIQGYRFVQEGEFYCLTAYMGSPQQPRRRPTLRTLLSDTGSTEVLSKNRARSPSIDYDALHHPVQRSRTGGTSRRASLPVFTLNRELHGVINPVNNADLRAVNRLPTIRDPSVTDDESCVFEGGETPDAGYDAGSSESEEEAVVEAPEVDGACRAQLPGFWLILRLTSSEAGLFFHVRESETSTGAMQKHKELIDEVARKIKAAAKVVNQELLLKDLLAHRRCNNLLEPETSDELWKGPGGQEAFIKTGGSEDLDSETTDGSYLEAAMHFTPGFFKCDVVYEYEFIIHPRLKMGPGSRVGQRAIQALSPTLSKFAVNNRQNMFVLEDNGAIFYFRLQDKIAVRRMVGGSSVDDPYVRGKDADLSPNVIVTEPDNNSLTRGSTSLDEVDGIYLSSSKNVDAIVFSFYGICEVSAKISTDLVTVLQNRLDEAVLDSLSVSLSRNNMLKLNCDDVRFVQPVSSEPAEVLELDLPARATESPGDLFRIFHYVLQNLSAFLHCPKYLDVDQERHFHFVNGRGGWQTADDEASFLYNRSQESGNKGLAFVYVVLSNATKTPEVQAEQAPESPLRLLEDFEALTEVRTVTLAGDLIFLMWEKGNIDRSSLSDKLMHSVHHALIDFWLEKTIIPSLRQPETSLPLSNCTTLHSFLKIGVDCKCPAYQATTYTLPNRRAIDLLAEQIMANLQNLNLNTAALISSVEDDATETDFVEAKIENAASMKEILLARAKHLVPGTFVSCRLLGIPVDDGDACERRSRSVSTDAPGDDKTKLRTMKRYLARVDHSGATCVPRGRLLYLMINDVTCQLFLYNFSPDTATTLEKAVARLFEWHHERNRLLQNILLQKCGIFQPASAFESRPGAEMVTFTSNALQADYLLAHSYAPSKDNLRSLQNPKFQHNDSLLAFSTVMEASFPSRFFADTTEAKPLDPVAYHGKQLREIRERKRRANSMRLRLHTLYEVWRVRDRRKITPPETLVVLRTNAKSVHFCASPLLFDPLWRKNLGTRFPDRQLLCASPVQRSFVVEEEQGHPAASNPPGVRSRHSSGVPTSAAKDKSRIVPPATELPPRRTSAQTPEQIWHTQIQSVLMAEYVHYLQLQGFSVVLIGLPSKPSNVRKSPQANTRATSGTSSPTPASGEPTVPAVAFRVTQAYTYLQRCVAGGMILLELYFMEPFLVSRLYAIDRCKFSDDFSAVGNDPDKALLSLQREIDRLKVAMHMHSFLYDFHLRCIMRYISGKQLFFKQGYHLVSFFDDFGNYYQKPPSYAKSSFQSGTLSVPCGSIPPGQLYSYILARDKQYQLNAVPMSSILHEDENDATTSALACSALECPVPGYEYSFIVYSDTQEPVLAGSSTLVLRYYIILSSKQDVFSTEYLEERFGSFKTLPPPKRPRTSVVEALWPVPATTTPALMNLETSREHIPDRLKNIPPLSSLEVKEPIREEGTERLTPIPGSSENLTAKASLISAFPNFLYIGYFSKQETELTRIVEEQKVVLENYIRKVVSKANSDCVRDTLWQRLAAVKLDDDVTRKRAEFAQAGRHREESGSSLFGMKSTTFEAPRVIPRLSAAEFQDLVDHVYRAPVVQWDADLSIFFQANSAWLEGLLDTLRVKYQDVQKFFVTGHGTPQTVQHLVIVCLNVTDVTLYLTLKSGANSMDAYILSRNAIIMDDLRRNQIFVEFMQGFVNCCCFHMWKTGLPV